MAEKNKTNEETMLIVWILWIVFVVIVAAIWTVRPLIMQENAYRRVSGEIRTSHMVVGRGYEITLSTRGTVFRAPSSHRDVLEEKAVRGSQATIWYIIIYPSRGNPHRRHIIQKMIVDDEVVIPFRERGIGGSIVFIIILLALFVYYPIRSIIKYRRQQEN